MSTIDRQQEPPRTTVLWTVLVALAATVLTVPAAAQMMGREAGAGAAAEQVQAETSPTRRPVLPEADRTLQVMLGLQEGGTPGSGRPAGLPATPAGPGGERAS